MDHTRQFVRGFITCPYSDFDAERIVQAVQQVPSLSAYRLEAPLYNDRAFPVVVIANEIELEADGTIRNRDAIALFLSQLVKATDKAEIAETWWNIRPYILGSPHGSRSSLFVSGHTGGHMRKILEAINGSGMFGPIKEFSLDKLSQKKRDKISKNLIQTAITNWDRSSKEFVFELRGEICKAAIRDTWDDGMEFSIRVEIGEYDLFASGFYYEARKKFTNLEIQGKRKLAEKFM